MIRIKRNENWTISNYPEIMENLCGSADAMFGKFQYYMKKYSGQIKRTVLSEFGSYAGFRNSKTLWYQLVDTRKIVLNDIPMTFYIWATTGHGVDIQILVETEDKKDYIIVFMTGAMGDGRGLMPITGQEDVAFVPVIVEDHFIRRYLQRQTYDKEWKAKMMLDFAFLGDYLDQVRWEVTEEFSPLTTDELIKTKESILDLYNDGKFEEVRDRLMRSCIISAAHKKFAFIMIPPKFGEMFVIKTFLEPSQLFDRQKEIVEFQTLMWFEIKKRCGQYIHENAMKVLKKEGAW